MAETAESTTVLRPGAVVIAGDKLRNVPEGTAGKVSLVIGLSWIRYWVDFANGESLGSVNRRNIFTPAEWKSRDEDGGADGGGAAGASAADDGAGPADAGGGGVAVNGVLVPQLLLDRAKAARERVGA